MLYLGIDIGKNNHVASLINEKGNTVFKAFYQKKRTEGKHHLTAIGAVARKLC